MSDRLHDLSQDPIIRGMAWDLVDAGIPPAPVGAADEADYVFAAAMEYTFRGGDIESLAFDDPAEAVRLAYEDLGGEPR